MTYGVATEASLKTVGTNCQTRTKRHNRAAQCYCSANRLVAIPTFPIGKYQPKELAIPIQGHSSHMHTVSRCDIKNKLSNNLSQNLICFKSFPTPMSINMTCFLIKMAIMSAWHLNLAKHKTVVLSTFSNEILYLRCLPTDIFWKFLFKMLVDYT